MALKNFKPYTKSTRGTVIVNRENCGKVNLTSLLLPANHLQAEEIIMEELLQDIEAWSKAQI